MKISEEKKNQLFAIKDKKMEAIKEQNFEKAANCRDQEVDFIEGNFGINVRHKTYSIIGNEIILNETDTD
jgi:hypothetical protein